MGWFARIPHNGVQALRQWIKDHTFKAFAVALVAGAMVYFWFKPVTPTLPKTEPVRAMPKIGTQQAEQDTAFLVRQREDAALRQQVPEMQKVIEQQKQQLRDLKQERQIAAETRDQQWKAAEDERNRKVDELMKRLQTSAPPPRTAGPAGQRTGKEPPAPVTQVQPMGVRLAMAKTDGHNSFSAPPPRPDSSTLPFLQYGSVAQGRIITGVMASSRAHSDLPILFAVTTPFSPPHQLQGPGRNSTATEIPLQGCRYGGIAAGDLANSRVLVELQMLSCVMPNGEAYVQPIKGYVTDLDGTYGIVARCDSHTSAKEAKLFLVSIMQELGTAFGYAKAKVLVTGTGAGGYQSGQGFQTGLQKMADLYVQQMELLLPTCWAESGKPVRIVVQENLILDGLPTMIQLAQGH